MVDLIEILAVLLFLLGCYGLAIGILQVVGFVPLKVSLGFRFLGASGLGNIAGGLGALLLGITVPLARVLDRTVMLAIVGIAFGLVAAGLYLSERRRGQSRS